MMSHSINSLFQLAAKFFYQQYREEGHTLDDLAERIGITSTYLSAVINGSRIGSLDLQNHIAQIFYGPYDKFIGVGRRIAEGRDPLADEVVIQDSVEKVLAQLTHLVMDHKREAEELKLSDRSFRELSISGGDIIFELDENLRIISLDGRFSEIIGLQEKDVLGRNIFKFYSEDEWKRMVPLIEHSVDNRETINTVLQVVRDEKTFYRHCIAKPVFAARNSSFSGFTGIYRDITAMRLREENLLDELCLLHEAISANHECAILLTDRDNRVVRWNKAFQELMGCPGQVVEKKNASHTFAFLTKQMKNPEDYWKRFSEFISSQEEMFHYFHMKNGKTIQGKATPVFREGIFTGRITCFTDVTEKAKTGTQARAGCSSQPPGR
jgi:PAS domain S-box-containing protein